MQILRIRDILSILAISFFVLMAIGSVDEEELAMAEGATEEVYEGWGEKESSINDSVSSINNDWLIGIWSNRGYSNSGADMTVKIQMNPKGKGRLYLLDQWLECTYEVYDDVVVATRNGVDIQFSFDSSTKAIYMADGTRLYKQ